MAKTTQVRQMPHLIFLTVRREFMRVDVLFLLNGIFLGVGLAMDAFSVSLANGLREPDMGKGRMCAIAGVFAGFQALMPMIGWVCVHAFVERFQAFSRCIPWIALILLCYIGGGMLIDSLRHKGKDDEDLSGKLGIAALLMQGVATSIDALSVGFTIADYELPAALLAALIIAAVTFVICCVGLVLGRKFGTKLAGKAGVLGGVILIAIGLEIFIKGVL